MDEEIPSPITALTAFMILAVPTILLAYAIDQWDKRRAKEASVER